MPVFWVPFIVKSVLVGTEHCAVRLRHSRTSISKAGRVCRPFFGSLYLENNVYLGNFAYFGYSRLVSILGLVLPPGYSLKIRQF